jgi:hypothetical protein
VDITMGTLMGLADLGAVAGEAMEDGEAAGGDKKIGRCKSSSNPSTQSSAFPAFPTCFHPQIS